MADYVKKEKPSFTMEELENVAKSCSTKDEFRKNHVVHYRYAMKIGVVKNLLDLIPRKRKWTTEALIQEGLKYKTRSEWMKVDISSYNTAIKLGVYDECIKHMGEKLKFACKIVWTYDVCKEIYQKHTLLKDLIQNDKGAYCASLREGWHEELSAHLIKNSYQKERKWTLEKVKKEALKYNSIKELSNNNHSAYCRALKNDWIKDIVGHMTGGNTKWTLEKLVEVLGNHPKNEWRKVSPAAHKYIKRHNLETQFMEKLNLSSNS